MSHSNVRTLSWFNLAHLLDKDGHQFGLHAEDSLPAARPITNHLQRVTIAAVATPYNLIREAVVIVSPHYTACAPSTPETRGTL